MHPRAPNIREILERVSLLEVVQEFVSLKKRGRTWVGLCPFHREKTPSFSVTPEKGVYYCFGCHAGGNALTFLMEIQGLTRSEAVVALARRAGITLPEEALRSPEIDPRARERENRLHVLQVAQQFFFDALRSSEGEEARRYLEGRGLPMEVADRFGVGYGGPQGSLTAWLDRQGVSQDLAVELGLLTRSWNGVSERFRDRLVCPVLNLEGVPVAFSARLIRPEPEAPKYLNSPESMLYVKGETVFGLHQARMPIRQQRRAVLVEGNFDVLSMVSVGFPNTVAPLGTALTPAQLRLIRRFAEEVVVFLDGDEAGRKASQRAVRLLIAEGIEGFVVDTPPGQDPDSLVRARGREGVEALLGNARPMFSWLVGAMVDEFGPTPHGKGKVVKAAQEVLGAETDPIRRRLYLEELARVLALDIQELSRAMRLGSHTEGAQTEEVPCPAIERQFLVLLGLEHQLLEQVLSIEKHEQRDFRSLLIHPEAQAIFQDMIQAYLEQESPADMLVRTAAKGGPLRDQVCRAIAAAHRIADPETEFHQVRMLLQAAALEREAREVEARILRLAADHERQEEVEGLQRHHTALCQQVFRIRQELQTSPAKAPIGPGRHGTRERASRASGAG